MQNELLKGIPSNPQKYSILDVDTLGLLNGCVDTLVEQPFYPLYLLNNTYLPLIMEQNYTDRIDAFATPGKGCKGLINACRGNATLLDPQFLGTNQIVNDICNITFLACFADVQGGSDISNATDTNALHRSAFDISHFQPDAYLPLHLHFYVLQSRMGLIFSRRSVEFFCLLERGVELPLWSLCEDC
jgi:carboxypeptidase D